MRFALAVPRQQLLLKRPRPSNDGSRLRCHATVGSDARGIFDVVGHGSNATVFDARDAIESCANCEDAEATACFAYFGCDRHRVERWYNVVAGLEQTLATPDDEELDADEYTSNSRFPEPFDSIFDMWAETAEAVQRAHTAQAISVDWPPPRLHSAAQT